MSRENVEVVRRWLTPSMSGDPKEAKAAVEEFCDADIDYYPVRKFAEAQPCHGRGEFSQFLAGWQEAWSRVEWAAQEVIEVGDDRVLLCANLRGRGARQRDEARGSHLPVQLVATRAPVRIEDHLTLSGALHALGLTGGTLEAAGLRE